MKFSEVVAHTLAWLQREGRVSYRALKLEFDLNDEVIDALKEELIDAKRLASDENGKVLVWVGALGAQGAKHEGEERGKTWPSNEAPRSLLSASQAEGERRQLTVMFCDLVGSTALSEQLDPEDLRQLVRAYQQVSAEVIARYEGYIAQYLGDGLLVYFGYPVAHEDEAPQAVRAALGILKAMQELNPRLPHPLQVRIGIHTGLVVVGEMGGGVKRELLALGEAPNIAARVQGIAAPDEVVMSASTARLSQGLFSCRALGLQNLKGISTPIELYQVLGESGEQSRFAAAHTTKLPPLVGREEESKLLWQRWEHVKTGTGQVVLLSGEPGIGNSRMLQTLKENIATESSLLLEGHCSPYYQNSPFYPLVDLLRRTLQFEPRDTSEDKLRKLENVFAPAGVSLPETVPLWATLLSLPLPQRYPALTLTPQKQKERTQHAVLTWLLAKAKEQPLFLVWEDLQWADPSTLEFLAFVIDHITAAPVYLLLTARPEFTPPWADRPHVTIETLSRLPHDQTQDLAMQITGGKLLPPEVLRQIITKTDGVPLFVEELTKTVLESGLVTAINSHYELTGPLPPLGIPSTLHDSLMARLDRLGTSKEVAQLGATLGREFTYGLIQAVSPLEEQRLQNNLGQLVQTEFLHQHGTPPHAHYLFRHALIQDTAYQSLLKSTRQHLHQQIATVLESQFLETVDAQPELLAHHYTEGGRGTQAIPYWQQAGHRAVQRSANIEAISHLTKGLELRKALPDTPDRAQQELMLQITLGVPLMVTRGYAAPEVEKAYTRARELCQQLGETPQLFPVLFGLWLFHFIRAELQTARELGKQLLHLAQSAQEPALLLEAHLALGYTLFHLGELVSARAHLEQTIALYDPQQHRSHAVLYGQEPGVISRTYAALALWLLGFPDQALKGSQDALTLAHECAHPYSLAFALTLAAVLCQYRREEHATREQAEATIALSTEQGFPFWLAMGTIVRGWALAEQGQVEEGITQMQQGLAAFRAIGTEIARPHFLPLLAEAYEGMGQVEEGLNALAEALAVANKTEERWYEAESYRLKGTLTLQSQPQALKSKVEEEAGECFWKAIEIARRQQAKSWELRAVMSLSRLWQKQGKKEEARQLLAEIYGWFTEGFDTKDLQEAKALLEELT